MARKPRKKSQSQIYHLILRGNNKNVIFYNDEDRFFLLKRMKKYSEETSIEIYAYCLMDNHVHILIGKGNPNLSKFVQKLATSYAMYFNRKYDRSGHLFQGRFKSEPVETDEYFKTVLRYILQNPYKARICDFNYYKWSSYQCMINTSTETFINTDYIYSVFSGKACLEQFISQENNDLCMEHENVQVFSDSRCIQLILNELKLDYPSQLKTKKRQEMMKSLRHLKSLGINVTQISRITDISRNIVLLA